MGEDTAMGEETAMGRLGDSAGSATVPTGNWRIDRAVAPRNRRSPWVEVLKRNDYEIAPMRLATLPLRSIRRPLERALDEAKVEALMASIAAEGLKEPIDVLEVDGQLWGFNGCHRVAAHERLGHDTIRARVRRATPSVLRMHLL